MNTQSPLFKTIARLLIAVMWAQPLHSIAANLNVDHQGGGNTHITSAKNGVPVVNIATPNGKGLSHNKFTDYNVGQQGLILNNSTDKLTSTQLGGIIFGNSQLKGKAANTILNEVTGGQRSQLKGYTEVAGQQAHVIVANPHGITCDGCGFINTPHATLTTGQPMLEQGQLKGYDVNGGDIEIAGAGLNASNLSRFDLITRSAKINAELHANELNIITGRNQVEAGTLKATAKTDTANDQPLLAIDSSALGGMYAGAIRLVGTEAGVGVKLAGDMAASAGDIRIDANGQLTLARVSASNGLHIKAADEVELTRQTYAGNEANIATDTLKNQGSLLAGQTIIIDADRTHNTGLVEAGVNADASLNNSGRVQVRGIELTNSGSIVASRELDVKATRQLNNRSGQLVSDGDLRLNAGQLDNRQGLMTAAGSTRITAGHIDNRNRGEISSQQQLSVKADQLDNSETGRLIGETSVSVQVDALDNQNSGVVAAAGSLSVTANRLDNRNQGLLKGAQGVSITTESLDNQNGGLVISDSQLRMEAQQIKNRAGVIDSRDELTLVAEQLENQSGQMAGGGDVRIQSVELDNTRGVVAAGTQLEVTASHVDNAAGELSAGHLLTLEGHTLQQAQGRILSGGQMRLNLKKLDNSGHGLVSAANGLEVRAGQLDNQKGSVISDDTLTVQAGQFNNHSQGLLASKGVLRIQATGLDQHDHGELISEQALHLELSGGDLDNSRGGLIYAPELYLHGVASLDNSQGGEISTPADLMLSAARLDNSAGLISSGQTLHVRIDTLLRNTVQGLLTAARDLQVEAQAVDNRQQGTLMGRNDVTVHAQTLDNRQQGAVLAGKQLKMTVTDLDNSHEGLINSQQTLHISSTRLSNSDGAELSSQRQLILNTETFDNRQGRLVSDGTLELTQSGPLLDNRGGLIHAADDLTMHNLQHVNNSQGGEISSQNTLQMALETLDNTHGGAVISSDRLRVIADSIDNRDQGLLSGYTGLSVLTRYLDNQSQGTLSSRQGALQVQVGEHLDNSQQGALVSRHALNVQAGSLNNRQGIVSSIDAVTLQLDDQLENTRGQIAGKNITITATQMDNTAGEISAEQALTLKGLSQVWNRQGGRMLSGSALLLQADTVDNQASTLASEGWLSLISGQLINRQHGGIAANQTLDIQAQHIDNHSQSQIYSQQAGVKLKADTLSNHDGLIQARTDLNLEIAGHASNQEGRLLSEQGAVTLQAATLDNRAGILASLLGQLKVAIQGLFGNQSGTVQGHVVAVQAAELANQRGHMAATAGDFALSTATLNNQGGGLYAHQHLALAADMLDNSNHGQIAGQTLDFSLSGSLNNQSGLIEAKTLQLHSATLDNRDGRLRALGTAGRSRIVSERGLDNRNGLIEIANQHFTLDAPELSNQAGQIVHAGSGQFDLLSGQARQVGGSVTSRGHVTLSSDTWENSTRFEAGALNLHVGHFTQTSSGQLIASQSLTATGDTWVNHGLIASDGDLSLTLSNGYSGSGQLVSLGDLDLFAPQLTVAAQGLVYGTGHTRIQGQQLTNRGNISPAGSLSIDVQQLTNRGTLGSAGMLDIKATGVMNEEGLIFSGNDMRLRVGQLSNRYADIYSLGNIDLAGVEAGARAQRVDNISASIEALGDFTLRSALIDNRRDVLEVRESGKYSVVISELPCHGPYRLGDCDLGSNGRRNAAWLVTEREKLDVVASSAASRLQAGGNLSVDGENLLNSSSQISSGNNLLLSVGQLTNQGVKPADIETQRIFTSGRKPSYYYYRDLANNFNAKHRPQVQQGSVEHDLSTFISRMEREYLPGRQTIETPLAGEEYSAIIQAAGQVTIDARQNLENSVIRPGYRYIGGGNRVSVQEPGSTHGTDVQIQAQLPPDQQQKQVDPTALPDFSLPSGDNGLFRLSDQRAYDQTVQAQEGALTSGQGASRAEQLAGQTGPGPGQYQPGHPLPGHSLPGADYTASAAEKVLAELQSLQGQNTSHNYLVETNPALTQMRQFLSSDYLLGELGLSPENMQKRLGDGLYEQKLMREALVARTGQRFLAGLDSDEAMFRYLMDNAIASKDALNLSVGISLSAEQVAALTHDIVWMEAREVMGEQVLVPVLYMAQAEGRLAPSGALIQGQDLALISGGDLSNQGTLRASNSLGVHAQNIHNSGLMQAGERLSLQAENSLYNRQGGILAGRDVDLTARTGDILNERSVTRHESALGSSRWETSFADSSARIEAANSLNLSAGRDVLNLGGVLNSGGDMQISAGRDVSLSSVEERHSISRGSHYLDSQTAQLISDTVAGSNLMIDAGRDLTAVASRIESGHNMQLVAGNDLTLASAANESHHYSKSKKVTSSQDRITQQSSVLQAGANVVLQAGTDLNIIGSQVQAGQDIHLEAGQDMHILSAQDESASFYFKKSKGSLGRSKSKQQESYQSSNVASVIDAGRNLTVNATLGENGAVSLDGGRNVTLVGSQLKAGNDLVLGATGDIAILSGIEEQGSYSKKTKSGFLGLSKSGKSQLKTTATQVGSELEAGSDLVVLSGRDIGVRASELHAGQDVELHAGLLVSALKSASFKPTYTASH